MVRIANRYFKNRGVQISGMALPTDPDGIVRDKDFVNCDFHPACSAVEFHNCTFNMCTGHRTLNNTYMGAH